jgi:ribonuclease-3
MPDSHLDEAQRRIRYLFRQPCLLEEALTHKSHVNEAREKGRKHNERLEFLGDAVLTLIISEHLGGSCPDFTEGELSKLKAGLVSEVSLAKAARRLDLGTLLLLGRGEELTQGREKPSLLANEDARNAGSPAVIDYKTRLQEWCQKRFETLPQYFTVRESGPDHQKTFEVQLMIKGDMRGVGVGRSKKEAEQMAAKQALAQVVE